MGFSQPFDVFHQLYAAFTKFKIVASPKFNLQARMDRIIIEFLQDIVSVLEDHLRPLVEAELSVLVDILYRPELLFPTGTDARRKCENGGFIR